METTSRAQSFNLMHSLQSEARRADFFEIMHYLLCSRKINARNLHLHVNPSLQFAQSDLTHIECKSGAVDLYTQMMGLIGVGGTLPQHYSELLLEQIDKKEGGLRDFLDIFENRALWNLYHAWVKHRFQIGYAINATHDKIDPLSNCLKGLAGYALETLSPHHPFSTDNIAFYSNLFFSRARSALGLQHLITTYFQWPVTIAAFQKEMMLISSENQCVMPTAQEKEGLNCQLGKNTLIGAKKAVRNQKIKIVIGPIKRGDFNAFITDNTLLNQLKRMIATYIGGMLNFSIELQLEPGVAKTATLGDKTSAILGMNSWCYQRDMDQQRKSITFTEETQNENNL